MVRADTVFMKAYSVDLRERIVAAATSGQSHRAVAERLGVAKTTVSRLVRQFDQQHNLTPGRATGKPPRLFEEHWQAIEAFLAETPNATVATVQTFLHDTLGVSLCASAVHDNLKRRGYTFKKRVWSRAKETNPTARSSEST
jgi:transposase